MLSNMIPPDELLSLCIVAVIKILLGGFQIFISQIHIIASTALTLNMLPFFRFEAQGRGGMELLDESHVQMLTAGIMTHYY